MATYSFVHIDLAEANVLGDLTGIRDDLLKAKEYARVLLKGWTSTPPDLSMVEPLSTAILVRYARAFATGVRLRLGEDALAVLTDEQRRTHESLNHIRDRHIAHSVNGYEANRPIARFCVERVHVEGITSIGCQHTRVIGLSAADLDQLIRIADALLAHVDGRIEQEKTRLLPLVRALPIDEVLKGTVPSDGIAVGNPGRSREKRKP